MQLEACGEAPAHWNRRAIGDVCVRVTSGGTPSRSNSAYYLGNVPWVKTKELDDEWIYDTEEHISATALAESSAKILARNAILIAMYGATVGQLGILAKPMTCNQACCVLEVDDGVADFRYLFYQLLFHRSQIRSLATGAAQQNLSAGQIREWILPFPSLAEQRRIAHILGTLDDKIELNRRMAGTLKEMARAIFKSWFIDFDPVRAKAEGRPTYLPPEVDALFPDSFEGSPLGPIPSGWTVGKIKDCCIQIQNGGTPKRNEPQFWVEGDIPWLTSGEVRQQVVTKPENCITKAGLAASSAKWVPPFSTVIALYGATAGLVSLISASLTTNQAVCALIPKEHYAYFNYLWMRAESAGLASKAIGSAQQNISKGIVEETPVVLASSAVVERFGSSVGPFFIRWISSLNETRALASLRHDLLPKLISGEVRVNA